MSTERHELAERRVRGLMEDADLPAPDEVEYLADSVRFLWHDKKVAVVIDLETGDEVTQ
jgi:hypothetical protein